jgi:hypothetical protein
MASYLIVADRNRVVNVVSNGLDLAVTLLLLRNCDIVRLLLLLFELYFLLQQFGCVFLILIHFNVVSEQVLPQPCASVRLEWFTFFFMPICFCSPLILEPSCEVSYLAKEIIRRETKRMGGIEEEENLDSPCRAAANSSKTSSTTLSGANRRRWLSLILFRSPPRSATKSLTSNMVSWGGILWITGLFAARGCYLS